MAEVREIEKYICFASSDEGFICNLPPEHDGPHQANATNFCCDGMEIGEKYVAKEWAK